MPTDESSEGINVEKNSVEEIVDLCVDKTIENSVEKSGIGKVGLVVEDPTVTCDNELVVMEHFQTNLDETAASQGRYNMVCSLDNQRYGNVEEITEDDESSFCWNPDPICCCKSILDNEYVDEGIVYLTAGDAVLEILRQCKINVICIFYPNLLHLTSGLLKGPGATNDIIAECEIVFGYLSTVLVFITTLEWSIQIVHISSYIGTEVIVVGQQRLAPEFQSIICLTGSYIRNQGSEYEGLQGAIHRTSAQSRVTLVLQGMSKAIDDDRLVECTMGNSLIADLILRMSTALLNFVMPLAIQLLDDAEKRLPARRVLPSVLIIDQRWCPLRLPKKTIIVQPLSLVIFLGYALRRVLQERYDGTTSRGKMVMYV